MTVMEANPEAGTTPALNPRDLIDPVLFDKLVARVQEDQQVAQFYAVGMVEQMLVYLKAVAEYGGRPGNLAPSKAVDPAWHVFVLHTAEYRAFCADLGGGFIEHTPVVTEDITSGNALARTLDAMRATGYAVDERYWQLGTWTSCCSTENCHSQIAYLA
ncbi:hypothetical protein [Actinomadura rayongensis]|uniref:Uncharacterized protein n=1 Tax=Actinomadura rayongensis TaxID=1429076 RepID=A0A6I4WLC3_9ACTN|nr:hypothetical protein [Actinomadura rayongensis]MXQ67734.1 hypothetical protein [Actinomadura rayongensis]